MANKICAKNRIIGITGKIGSGKSFIGEYLSRETGFGLVKLDYQVAQIINRPILKQILQFKIKNKIPKPNPNIQLFPLYKNLKKDFSRFENAWVLRLLNKKLNKLVNKTKKPLIIDFVALSSLDIISKLERVYLVESDEDARIKRLSNRDGLKECDTKRIEKFLYQYYQKNDECSFDGLIENDYAGIPDSVKFLANKLKLNQI